MCCSIIWLAVVLEWDSFPSTNLSPYTRTNNTRTNTTAEHFLLSLADVPLCPYPCTHRLTHWLRL